MKIFPIKFITATFFLFFEIKIPLPLPGDPFTRFSGLNSLFSEIKDFDEPFMQASKIINKDLINLINKGSAEELSKTEITQPLLLTANYAIWKIIEKKDIKIDFLAGHSLGEYSALIASKSISFEDCLKIVNKRAQLMQNAVPEGKGGIAAIIGLGHS